MKTNIKKSMYTLLISLISIFSLAPFYIMLVMGTYKSEDLYTKIVLWPGNYIVQNVRSILKTDFFLYYWNSFYIAVLATALSVFVSMLTGFALSKYDFKHRKSIFYFIVSSMMIPSQLGLVAYVIEMRMLHFTNTHIPLIIGSAASAFGVFWMTQYIGSAVPASVIESARIDGCHEFIIFLRIVIPFIKPAIVTLCMLAFLASWNNYLMPLVLLNNTKLYTIPLGISTLGNYYRNDYGAEIMGLSLGCLPLVLLFASGSKHFISGLTAGAVKG